MEVGGEGDYIPIATMSPPELFLLLPTRRHTLEVMNLNGVFLRLDTPVGHTTSYRTPCPV